MRASRRLGVGIVLLVAGCGPRSRWMVDESERIDAVIRKERFCVHDHGAAGIALSNAPPLAPPFPLEGGYRLRQARERRIATGRARAPPRSTASKPRPSSFPASMLARER